MKILYVTTISNTLNAFLIPHIKMLVDQGHQVDVACNIEAKLKPELLDLVTNIFEIPFSRSPIKSQNIQAYKQLKSLVVKEKYDIVHTHTPVASMVVRLACRNQKNTKVFYTAHGFHFFKGASIKNWFLFYPIEKLLSKYTDTLITINQEDYDLAISKKFKANNVKLIPGVGVDIKEFKQINNKDKMKKRLQLGFDKEDFILIYVAELSYRKNQEMMIEVISLLKSEIPNIKLLLVGSGSKKDSIDKMIKQLKLENEVELLGFRKDIVDLMQISDVAVSTSRQEGLPVNIMEAMAVGLPLVVTNVRGNRDLVDNEYNGNIVEIGAVRDFANEIIELFNNIEKRVIFKKNSVEKVRKYSEENIINDIFNIYA